MPRVKQINASKDYKLIRLGGGWQHKEGSGISFEVGDGMEVVLNAGDRLVMFENKKKTDEKQPDYVLYIDPRSKEERVKLLKKQTKKC